MLAIFLIRSNLVDTPMDWTSTKGNGHQDNKVKWTDRQRNNEAKKG